MEQDTDGTDFCLDLCLNNNKSYVNSSIHDQLWNNMSDDVFLKIYIFTPVSTPHQCFQTTEKLNLRIHNFVT